MLSRTKKIHKKLKFLEYFKILSDNKLIFICLYKNDLSKPFKVCREELAKQGFRFKFVENKKIRRFSFFKNVSNLLNGRLLLVYKNDFSSHDNLNVRYFLKNFFVTSFIYRNKMYSAKNLNFLDNKHQRTDVTFFREKCRSSVLLGLFGGLFTQVKLYENKLKV